MSRTQTAMRIAANTLNSYWGLGRDLPDPHLMERLLV